MSEGTRKFKMNVAPPLPICAECPWRIWCPELNFRVQNPKGVTKVCPIWWMLMIFLREKGILKDRPTAPLTMPPISSEEARAIMEAARRKRMQELGMVGQGLD